MKLMHSSIAFSLFVGVAIAAHGQEFLNPSPNAAKSTVPPNLLERVLKQADLGGATPYVCVTSALPPIFSTPNTDPRIANTPWRSPSDLPTHLLDIESLFKMTDQKFGDITALAPATMTVLSVGFPPTDLYANLSSEDAFKLLAATLSDDQWKALTSDQGLCGDDLTSDKQRELWIAALHMPEKILLYKNLYDETPRNGNEKPNPGVDITDKLMQFRLHLHRDIDLSIPTSDGSYEGANRAPVSTLPKYHIGYNWGAAKSQNGFQPRQELPNTPKKSDLTYDASNFDPSVSMTDSPDLATLLLRVGLRTKTELYCDTRMAKFHVVMAPATGTIRAGDLLKALAFDVTGTFRKVGPVYILTNDLMGVGTKIALIAKHALKADEERRLPLGEAGDIIDAKHNLWELPLTRSKELDLTLDQHTNWAATQPGVAMDPNFGNYTAKFSELTAAQQAAARARYDSMLKSPDTGDTRAPRLDKDIMINSSPTLRMTIPGVDGDVDLQNNFPRHLFDPSDAVNSKRITSGVQMQSEAAKVAVRTDHTGSKLPLQQQFAALCDNRAIAVTPTSVDEAKAVVLKAKALGFNQVWISVLSPLADEEVYSLGGLSAREIEIVHQAAVAGAARNVAVFVHLSLFEWPKSTPAELRDIDILGQDSANEYVTRKMSDSAQLGQPYTGPAAKDLFVRVNPLDARVQNVLATVNKQIALIPGIAGVVWSNTGGSRNMGYTEQTRVSYVRKAQIDPVDIFPNSGSEVDMSLPMMQQDQLVAGSVDQNWQVYRSFEVDDFLKGLRSQINPPGLPASKSKTLLVAERSDAFGWFGSWDSAVAPLPTFHQYWDQEDGAKFPTDPARQARTESRISFAKLWFSPVGSFKAMLDAAQITQKPSRWDGIVVNMDNPQIEFYDGVHVDSSVETLDKLMESLRSSTPERSVKPAKLRKTAQ